MRVHIEPATQLLDDLIGDPQAQAIAVRAPGGEGFEQKGQTLRWNIAAVVFHHDDQVIILKVFGIAGHSGMGKTTLLERLVPEISGRGQLVSLIKHSHKNIDIDRPGKDSYRLREAGCKEVLLLGNDRWALMHELRGGAEPSLDFLLERMQDCDLVLIEGFKNGGFPKLEVWREGLGKAPLWPDVPGIVAIASDTVVPDASVTLLALSDVAAIAAFVLENAAPR